MSTGHDQLRELLYGRFRQQPDPVLSGDGFNIAAASLWAGARAWTAHLRRMDLGAGDAVTIALPPGPAAVQAMLACWWQGVAICPGDHAAPRRAEGTSVLIAPPASQGPHTLCPGPLEIPAEDDATVRAHRNVCASVAADVPGDPVAILSYPAAGSVGRLTSSSLVRLLWANALALRTTPDHTFVCVLPWSEAPGLVGGLWPALLTGARVVACPAAFDGPASGLLALRRHEADATALTPDLVRAMLELPGGPTTLGRLRGIVTPAGGLAPGEPLTEYLARERGALRAA